MPLWESPNSLLGFGWPNTQSVQIPQSIVIPTPHYNNNNHAIPPNILSEQGWFLHPDSWEVKRTYVPSIAGDPHSIFRAFVKSVKAWLGDFATTGHNIFIHRRLYQSPRVRGGMPTCLQDAWLTITAYLAKTDQTEELILQILDDRADRLLSEQHLTTLPPEELDIRAQLARTQALLIYTFIRLLYDNPPEQRTKALSSLPVLSACCHSLCDAAIAQAPSLYLSSNSLIDLTSSSAIREEVEQMSLWHAFIVSESIRRTWMLVSSVLRIFNQAHPPSAGVESMDLTTVTPHRCLGFLSFTIRAGLWDAENAFQWGPASMSVTPVFLESVGILDRILEETTPEDVDSWTNQILRMVLPSERIDRWARKMRNVGPQASLGSSS
ncbi:putative rna polymerase [Rhypophila sp. PSN 637]